MNLYCYKPSTSNCSPFTSLTIRLNILREVNYEILQIRIFWPTKSRSTRNYIGKLCEYLVNRPIFSYYNYISGYLGEHERILLKSILKK